MKSLTVLLFAFFTLGFVSCTSDSIAESEALYIQSNDEEETEDKDRNSSSERNFSTDF